MCLSFFSFYFLFKIGDLPDIYVLCVTIQCFLDQSSRCFCGIVVQALPLSVLYLKLRLRNCQFRWISPPKVGGTYWRTHSGSPLRSTRSTRSRLKSCISWRGIRSCASRRRSVKNTTTWRHTRWKSWRRWHWLARKKSIFEKRFTRSDIEKHKMEQFDKQVASNSIWDFSGLWSSWWTLKKP